MPETICQRHVFLQITPDQYDIVGKFLIEAMQEVLGQIFTPSVHNSWTAVYSQLASLMIQKKRSLYNQDTD